jgi:hypothetical protein
MLRGLTPIRRFKLHAMALAIGLCFAVSAHAGQTEKERIAELEKKLDKSMALIEQLSSRLHQLESSKPTPQAVTATIKEETRQAVETSAARIATQEAQIVQLERSLLQVAESTAKRGDLGLPLHGFLDVGYAHSSQDLNGRKSGFVLGNLDLYLTPQFGDRVKSIVEMAFEYNEKGDAVGTDLERLQIGYTFSDALTLWAGRVHTPYGYWNTAYHHGGQLQPSILRPRMVAFEDQGGILPSHSVGMMASGSARMANGRLSYDFIVGNGSRITGDAGDKSLDYNAGKDDNSDKAVGANVRYAFNGELDGVTVGLHALTEQINEETTPNKTRMNMMGGYLVLDRNNWEVIGEYYKFNNKDLSGTTGSHSSWAGFVHAGYAINDFWTPYLRIEKASLDQRDNYFLAQVSGRSYNRQVGGIRYNLNNSAALKFELNQTTETVPAGDNKFNEARLQFAVRF